jgi:hypothetical protein
MPTFSNSLRSFKDGLDAKLLWTYWVTFKDHAWETFWGATALGIPFGLYTLYRSPSAAWLLLYLLCVSFVAGYYIWRADHVRLIPKLSVIGTRLQDTPIVANGMVYDHRTFIQLLPRCLTEAPVYECAAFLQRVDRFRAGHWEDTGLDINLRLNWGDEHHPSVEQPVNVFFIEHQSEYLIPCLPRDADMPLAKFEEIFRRDAGGTTFRFYVQITYSDRVGGHFESVAKPVQVRLDVQFGNDPLNPLLELTQLD